ncbi:MAG TPA: class I SAM-dependent methyltransferase [Pseudonocardiaceae bacterium]|jgi:SAM-dependent methyltransferase|nr:class I SAM-dependent methyltransferase [Pseudonocardiaceae bacterium]
MDSVTRFEGLAAHYDRSRPTPPRALTDLLRQWIAVDRPDVVDLGAGSGLATELWSGQAASVTAIEPGADMRAIAGQRLATLPDREIFALVDAPAEVTGLPDACADVVVASQAMHWFDPARVIPEIARLLRPGGVFAAIDCDFPPAVLAAADAAYDDFQYAMGHLEVSNALQPAKTAKREHLGNLSRSGLFRRTTEICLHKEETGDGQRLVDIALSQGGAKAALDAGFTEEDLAVTGLRAIAATIPADTPFWWTYRVRLAWK